jgi:DNA-binding GntR family transcriptional regulator
VTDLEPQVRDRVYRFLRQSIVTGDLRSGTRLVEDRISEELNVSRTPVREAIQRLTSDGLVTRVRRGQVEVRHVEQEERDQLHLLRLAFDRVAATLIAPKVDVIDWDVLYQSLDRLEVALETKGLGSAEVSIAHLDLHLGINMAAFQDNVAALVMSQGFLYIVDPNVQPVDYDPIAEHRLLLDEIRSGDEERTITAMREHAVLKTDARHPGSFTSFR